MEEQIQSSWQKLLDKLVGWLDAVFLNLPNFLIAITVFLVAYWLSGTLQNVVNKSLKKVIKQPSIRALISKVASVGVIVIGLVLALSVMNLDGTLKSLLAGAGVAGLAIGLALQGTIANTFSGIFLAVKDEVNIGDWIETNGFSGTVTEIDLRNTKIREPDNNIVVIPNKMIMDNPFKNYGLTQQIRCIVNCGVGYESDLREVREIAVNAIADKFPPPSDKEIEFFFTEFGGSSIDFLLRFWVDAKAKITALEVQSEAIMTIKDAFDENDINIPFPIRTLQHENQPSENPEAQAND